MVFLAKMCLKIEKKLVIIFVQVFFSLGFLNETCEILVINPSITFKYLLMQEQGGHTSMWLKIYKFFCILVSMYYKNIRCLMLTLQQEFLCSAQSNSYGLRLCQAIVNCLQHDRISTIETNMGNNIVDLQFLVIFEFHNHYKLETRSIWIRVGFMTVQKGK